MLMSAHGEARQMNVSWHSTLNKDWDIKAEFFEDSVELEFLGYGNSIGFAVTEDMIPEVLAVLTQAQEHFRKLDDERAPEPQTA